MKLLGYFSIFLGWFIFIVLGGRLLLDGHPFLAFFLCGGAAAGLIGIGAGLASDDQNDSVIAPSNELNALDMPMSTPDFAQQHYPASFPISRIVRNFFQYD
ncbi:hypothetical protein [Halomonas lysinitropha]|uniref:hypothetical protein n=1 Tax=Halomonas lysinitropha TaxID=2607506 RepID=UPI00124A33C7|nr:hypothetical protein [Halomonas lysinitropha]